LGGNPLGNSWGDFKRPTRSLFKISILSPKKSIVDSSQKNSVPQKVKGPQRPIKKSSGKKPSQLLNWPPIGAQKRNWPKRCGFIPLYTHLPMEKMKNLSIGPLFSSS